MGEIRCCPKCNTKLSPSVYVDESGNLAGDRKFTVGDEEIFEYRIFKCSKCSQDFEINRKYTLANDWDGKDTKSSHEWWDSKKQEKILNETKGQQARSGSDSEIDEKNDLSEEEMEIMEEYKQELAEMREKLQKEEIHQKTADNYGGYTFESSIEDHTIDEDSLDYNRLTDEEERRKIRTNMAKAHIFLEKLGIKDMNIDPKKSIIIVPFEYESYHFLSHLIVGSDWYIVKASLMDLTDVDPLTAYKIFVEILKANFILNDVTYSLDPEGTCIWTEADIPSDLDFDHFKLEYLSIVFAIDFFIKHIPDKIHIHSTYCPK